MIFVPDETVVHCILKNAYPDDYYYIDNNNTWLWLT